MPGTAGGRQLAVECVRSAPFLPAAGARHWLPLLVRCAQLCSRASGRASSSRRFFSFFQCRKSTFLSSFFSWNLSCRMAACALGGAGPAAPQPCGISPNTRLLPARAAANTLQTPAARRAAGCYCSDLQPSGLHWSCSPSSSSGCVRPAAGQCAGERKACSACVGLLARNLQGAPQRLLALPQSSRTPSACGTAGCAIPARLRAFCQHPSQARALLCSCPLNSLPHRSHGGAAERWHEVGRLGCAAACKRPAASQHAPVQAGRQCQLEGRQCRSQLQPSARSPGQAGLPA